MKSVTTFAALCVLLLPLSALRADPHQDPMIPHWIPRPVVRSGYTWQASYRWSGPGQPPPHQVVTVLTHSHASGGVMALSYGVRGVITQTATGYVLVARTRTQRAPDGKPVWVPFFVSFSLPYTFKPVPIPRGRGPVKLDRFGRFPFPH